MECIYCKTEIENIMSLNGGIYIDIKSRSIKIYFKRIVYNHNEIIDFNKSKMEKEDKDTIKNIIKTIKNNEFDFIKNDNNGYKKLAFCSIICYDNYNK
jgi:hypothetical protein